MTSIVSLIEHLTDLLDQLKYDVSFDPQALEIKIKVREIVLNDDQANLDLCIIYNREREADLLKEKIQDEQTIITNYKRALESYNSDTQENREIKRKELLNKIDNTYRQIKSECDI